jgi:mono/diheme cytochrome c family protein
MTASSGLAATGPSRWRRKAPACLLAAVAMLLLAGCRADMQNQPYQRPLVQSDFYTDKRSARPIIAGTVARGHLDADAYFFTGKIGNNDGDYLPFPVTAEVLARGQQRFNIYCSPCHSEIGDGNGMIVQRGYKRPPSYHIDRLRKAPIGYFFDVMTNGFGAMPDYSQQVQPADRWAIAAYIRALQLSQHATDADVPAGTQIAATPPQGIIVMPPYDTQGAGTAASTPPPASAAGKGGAQKQ